MGMELIRRGHAEIEPANCPHCGAKITTVTRGQQTERGPILPTTLNCGHEIDGYIVRWVEDEHE